MRNDHPFGLALTLKQRAGNPQVLKVAAWLAHESGIKSAQFETEEGTVLGNLRRQRSRVRFGTLPRDLVRDAAAPMAVGSVWSAARANTLPAGIHRLQIRVKAADGAETVIPAQLVANSPASRAGAAGGGSASGGGGASVAPCGSVSGAGGRASLVDASVDAASVDAVGGQVGR